MDQKIKFTWQYLYVPEGQLEPDKYGRWGIRCYIYANLSKSLPNYGWCKDLHGKYMPISVATIIKTDNDQFKYKACVPSFEIACNWGLSNSHWFYSNSIEELKATIEAQFEEIRNVFMNCKLEKL